MVDEVLNFLEDEFSDEEDSDNDFDGYIDSECEADEELEAENEHESESNEEMEAECETYTDVLVETCDEEMETDNIAPSKQKINFFNHTCYCINLQVLLASVLRVQQ